MPTLRELEKKVSDGLDSHQNAVMKAKEILSKISEGQQTLRELKREINNFKENCKAAKFASTYSSVVAGTTAAVALGGAIFTGGTSLVLVPVCSALSGIFGIGGATIKVTTDVVDHVKTKRFVAKINDIMSSLRNMIDKMQTLQNIANETIKYFQGNFKLKNEKVSSIINKFFVMSSKLKKGAEQTGSIGVLIIVLAMANPSSANPAAGIAFAQQFYAYYQTIVAPIIMQEVARQVIIQQQTLQVLNLMAHLSVSAGQTATPAVEKVVSSVVQAEVKTGTRVAVATGKALAAEIAMHGVMTSLNVGLAIWDIVSLVQTWNDVHPAVEVIEKVLLNLTQIEQSIQTQLEVMVDTKVEPLVTTRADVKTSVKSEVKKTTKETEESESSDSESSDSDEEEEDKVRIYDKTTDTMKGILQLFGVSGVSKPEDHYDRSVSELVSLIQMVLETTGNRNHQHQHPTIQRIFNQLMGQKSTFTIGSYFLMIDYIHVLIALHGAVLKKSQEPSIIVLEIPKVSESITFDSHDRNYFRNLLLPIYAIKKIPLIVDKRCCIYRFHCIKCEQECEQEFNYVGQSRNLEARYKTHTDKMLTTWMDHEDRMNAYQAGIAVPKHVAKTPSSLLYEHPHQCHYSSKDKFSDIYEVDIVSNLQGNNTTSETDSQVRRSWEVYYQWLFQARTTEGGGSRR